MPRPSRPGRQRNFFDVRSILDPVERGMVRGLIRGAKLVYFKARSLIRPANNSSRPGSPPHSHTGILRDRLFYDYDPAAKAAVIGPEKANQVHFMGAGDTGRATPPEVLEEGGTIAVLEVWSEHQKKWLRADLRSKRKLAARKTRLRNVNIAARPFMGPALAKVTPKIPDLWADVVTD